MKKLMTLLGVMAFALGAFAVTTNQIGFESLTAGDALDINATEQLGDLGNAHLWCSAEEQVGTVTAYGDDATYSYGAGNAALVEDGPGAKYLKLDAQSTLYRTLVSNSGVEGIASVDLSDDLVIDTLVQFSSPTEGIAVPTLDDGVKFAISLCSDEEAGTTNLYVTAAGRGDGAYYGSYVATNYLVSAAVEPAEWCRVTVRAVTNIYSDNSVGLGFVLYINGQIVSCDDPDYENMLPAFAKSNLATYLVGQRQLFVSIVQPGIQNAKAIAAVGFKGSGSVDDITLCDADEASVAALPAVFKITWGEGIASFKYNVDGGAETTVADASSGSLVFALPAGAQKVYVTDVTYQQGFSGNSSFELTVSDGDEQELVSNNVQIVGGDTYPTLAAAIAAAQAGDVIQLLSNLDETVPESVEYGVGFYVTNAITLDLNGNELTLIAEGDGEYKNAFTLNAPITVISSSAGGLMDVSTLGVAFFDPQESGQIRSVIGAVDDDAGVTIEGTLTGWGAVVSIVRGKFTDSTAGDYCAQGSHSQCNYDGEKYYVVEPGAELTYDFTVAAIANATATWTVDGVASEGSVSTQNEVLKGLTNDTEVVVTYEPDDNYRFATGSKAEETYKINNASTNSAGQVVVERIPYAGTDYAPWSYSKGVILWRGTEANFHASTVIDVAVDGTLGTPYAMTADQSDTSWQRFASNQSAYSSPGKVLVYDTPGTDQGYKYNPNCTFGPLSFGGMWVKTLAINGLPFSILGSGDRSTEFGATGASTFFKFDASYTIDRTGTTTFYGDATVEIADGATFTAQANGSHVVAVDSSATLKLQGAGTLAVTTMNVAGTLDLSAATVPSISGNVAFAGYSTLVLPADTALNEAISLEVCSGTLSAGVVYVKVGDGEPVEAALTISDGSITQITTGIQTEQTFTSEPYPDVVPVGYTYTYVTTDAVTIPAVTVNGTLKTSGPFTISNFAIASGADFEVVDGNTTVGDGGGNCQLKGNITVDAGATLTNTKTDTLDYSGSMTVDIYGTLAMGATRWSIPGNCTFKLHAGAQVTGPGDNLASLDFISGATKGLDVYAGEASSARIEGKVRVRANESRIWVGDNTTLVLESGIADGGGHAAGFKQVGPGTLEVHANSTGLSGNASVMTQGTLRIVDTTRAFPVALQGSNSYLEIVATEEETTVPVNVTTANNNISFSGAGKASGSIVFAEEPSSAVQSFLQDNWIGTATLNYAITGASNGTAFKACLYGNENSTVCLGQGATNIFFADAAGTAPGVGTKLYFKGDVSLKNGWAYNQNIALPARSNETVIPELGADEGVTFTTRQDGNRTTFFRIQTLKNFAGTIAVQARNDVLIDKVELAELPEVGTLVVKATKADEETSVIAGTATAGDDYADLVFDTVNEVSGLYVALTPIAVPTAATGLTYDGTVKTGVAAGTGYTITGNTGTDAGSYQATATLKSGYVWEGGATAAQTIDWSIAQKSVTATITLTVASAQLDAEKTTVGAYTAVSAVSFGDDTLTVNVDYTISGLDAQVSAAGDYDVTVQPAASGSNYTFEPAKATLTITASSGTYEVTGDTVIGEGGSFTVPEGTTAIKVGGYTLENGDGISIDGTTVTVLAPEVVEEAEKEAIVIDDDNDEVTLNVDLVPGLYYGVGVATSLEDGINRPVTLQQFDGTNKGDILTVTKPEGVKGFFKVFVDIKQ